MSPPDNPARKVMTVTVIDPDTSGEVQVEIFKHASSGGMFGIDASFLETTNEPVFDPFDGHILSGEDFDYEVKE